jgi:hypothetical protein
MLAKLKNNLVLAKLKRNVVLAKLKINLVLAKLQSNLVNSGQLWLKASDEYYSCYF